MGGGLVESLLTTRRWLATAVGTRKTEAPEVELSTLIELLNERFGTDFTPADELFIDQMDQNEELFARFMNDKDFQRVVAGHLMKNVYEQIREDVV